MFIPESSLKGSNCSLQNASSPMHHFVSNVRGYFLYFIIIGLINVLLHGVSFAVFIFNRREQVMRRLLMLLSFSEILAHLFCLLFFFQVLLFFEWRFEFSSPFVASHVVRSAGFSFIMMNMWLLMRNWCIILIAGSRCEAICRPLQLRAKQIFTQHTILIIYAVCVMIALLICIPRGFEFTFVICHENNQVNNQRSLLDTYAGYNSFKIFGYFTLQTLLPVIAVGGLAVVMLNSLNKRVFLSSRRQQEAASRLVVILSVTFFLFEFPSFVMFSMRQFTPNLPAHVKTHLTFVPNVLIGLDSVANFVIYIATSTAFRVDAERLCPWRRPIRNANVSLSNQNHTYISNTLNIKLTGKINARGHPSDNASTSGIMPISHEFIEMNEALISSKNHSVSNSINE